MLHSAKAVTHTRYTHIITKVTFSPISTSDLLLLLVTVRSVQYITVLETDALDTVHTVSWKIIDYLSLMSLLISPSGPSVPAWSSCSLTNVSLELCVLNHNRCLYCTVETTWSSGYPGTNNCYLWYTFRCQFIRYILYPFLSDIYVESFN